MERARLARASAADQRDVLARRDSEARAVQYRLPRSVAEYDVVEEDRCLIGLAGRGVDPGRRIVHGCGEGREDALGAGHRPLNRLPLFAERGDRLKDTLQEDEKRRQGAERDTERGEALTRAGPQERRERQRGQDGGDRSVEG